MRDNARAIETRYAGHRFRSRLEARWAVFFTRANIPWLYEPQGFTINSHAYLPDFYLPECGTWIEVKGTLHGGEFEFLTHAGDQLPLMGEVKQEHGPRLVILGQIPEMTHANHRGEDICWYAPSSHTHYSFGNYHKNSRPWWNEATYPTAPPHHSTADEPTLTPRILDAYTAARSARFEHGERG